MATSNSTNGRLIPAVAYVRMSTDRQEDSPAQQRAEIEQFAEGKYRIVRWYQDEGISGDEALKRKEFQRLIADAKEGADFEVVLCWDQDRFSRFDPLEANYYWHILRTAGVRIVTVAQGELNFEDLGAWLMASVNQYGKHQFLRDLSRNVVRGMLARANEGRWIGSSAPYGYRVEDGRLLLGDSDRVNVVRWIFEQYLHTDTSLADLADQLNKRGLDAPSGLGRKWQKGSLQGILKREAYAGRAIQFRQAKGKFHTVRNGQVAVVNGERFRPAEEGFVIECPAIVDEDLWQAVQAKLRSRRRKTNTKRSEKSYLLSGLLYCAHCGGGMIAGSGGRNAPGDGSCFQCSSYVRYGKHGCYRNLISEAPLLDALVPKIQQVVLSDENLNRLRIEIRRQLEAVTSAPALDLASLRNRLTRLEGEVKTAARNLNRAPDDLFEELVVDLRKIKAERDDAAVALAEAETPRDAEPLDMDARTDQAISRLETLREDIQACDKRVARAALQQLIERIDLQFRHTHHSRIVRSHFEHGVVCFRSTANSYRPANVRCSHRRETSGPAARRARYGSCPRPACAVVSNKPLAQRRRARSAARRQVDPPGAVAEVAPVLVEVRASAA